MPGAPVVPWPAMSSPSVVESVPLARTSAETAATVLARAFWDDPLSLYILPDDRARTAGLPAFFASGVALGQLYGEAWTTPGTVEGAAIWLRPGATEVSDEMVTAAGGPAMALALGEPAMLRFGRAMSAMSEHHFANMTAPHWYLLILGVEPRRQGEGVGGKLIAPVLRRADEAGVVSYLETTKRRNLPFYRKHGFEVVSEGTTSDGELRFWSMARPPRKE